MKTFANSQIKLVGSKDAVCGAYWDETKVGAEQDAQGPTQIIVGRFAPDDKLSRIGQKYGYSIEDLRSFRDGLK